MRVSGACLPWVGGELVRLYDGVVRFGREFFPDPRGAVLPEAARLDTDAALARIAERGMAVCGGHLRLQGEEEAEAGVGFLRRSAGKRGWEARAV